MTPGGGESVAPARPAASIMLIRDSPAGPEVLLVERNPAQRFMGGAWVFPGGACEEADGDESATAIRELEEEAGIVVAPTPVPPRFSRWVTPAEVELRFDTHFFLALASAGAEPHVDGHECVAARWIRPQRALDAGETGELLLVRPTISHLEALAGFTSAAQALAVARTRHVLPLDPDVLARGGVARVLMPGDPGYPHPPRAVQPSRDGVVRPAPP